MVVTGCVVNLHPGALTELSPRVIAEPSKIDVARTAARAAGLPPRCAGASGEGHDLADLLGRSRLGIKVQDGCNNRCSYCIVWKARGPERSVPVEAVLDQVREAERAGIPEVVLTGVNLGAYDGVDARDAHVEIDELLNIILRETDIQQVRLSSLEPMDVDERLIDAMVAGGPRVAPFLHLPLQSGCSATLERMNRPYTAGAIRGHGRHDPRQAPGRLHLVRHHRGLSRRDGRRVRPEPGAVRARGLLAACTCSAIARARGRPPRRRPTRCRPRSWRSARASCAPSPSAAPRPTPPRAWALSRTPCWSTATGASWAAFHRVIVDDAPQDRTGSLVRVHIDSMDDRGILHAHVVPSDPNALAAGDDELAGKGGRS